MKDFFKYNVGLGLGQTNPVLDFSKSTPIRGLTKAIWVERYREPGEFTFEAPLEANLGGQLPLGSLVSHTNTLDLMIVEDREITITDNSAPIEVITGRSFTSFMDYRLCGNLIPWTAQGTKKVETYTIPSAATWVQLESLINSHLDPGSILYYGSTYGVNQIKTFHSGFSTAGEIRDRPVKAFQTLLQAVIEVAEVEDIGIKCLRPPAGYSNTNTKPDPNKINFMIHKGKNRGQELAINSLSEFKNAKYFWSSRNMYNRAEIRGKWVHVRNYYTLNAKALGLREIFLQEDYDGAIQDQPPVGSGAETFAVALLQYYAGDVMRSKHYYWRHAVELDPAASFASKYHYRVDYDLGDLITVRNDYDAFQPTTLLRVVEFAETWDENTYEAIPTLVTPIKILGDS